MRIPTSIRQLRKIFFWVIRWNKKLTPPPAPIKRILLRRLARNNRLRLFVETGTYLGGTISKLEPVFDRLFSIELNADYCSAAQRMFFGHDKVTILCGDSADVLPRIIPQLTNPALFWLDAHYSGGTTARASTDTPIERELSCILSDHRHHHVVAIDDASDFGHGDYPTIASVTALAHRYGRTISVRYNMIVIA